MFDDHDMLIAVERVSAEEFNCVVLEVEFQSLMHKLVWLSENHAEFRILLSHSEWHVVAAVACSVVAGVNDATEEITGSESGSLGLCLFVYFDIVFGQFPPAFWIFFICDLENVRQRHAYSISDVEFKCIIYEFEEWKVFVFHESEHKFHMQYHLVCHAS